MKYSLFITAVFALLFAAACKKDKFTTEPQVKAKSIKPGIVIKGQTITFTSSFTDDEGDVQDSVLIVFKRFTGSTILTTDTLRLRLDPGQIPKARQGDIIVKFGYGELISGTYFINLETTDREASFGIVIIDNAGNRSNYAESDKILLKKL
jgi:hypothetical protein